MASVWGELKRRNVVKVAVAYAVVGWLLIEVASTVFPIVQLPDWTVTLVTMLLILGFPVALIFSWAYELTPEGMKRSHEVPATQSIAQATSRKIDFAIIGALALALGFVGLDNYVLDSGGETAGVLPNSVAVLPFENMSANPNDAYFASGMHDEILNQLAKIRDLNVIARTSVMQYAGAARPITEIARELNVGTIMEGSVSYADDRVAVRAQLIDAETGVHLWSDSYNREFSDVFGIQVDIAMSVANALEAEFSVEEQASIERISTTSPTAHRLYLRSRAATGPAGRLLLDQAIEADPDFALAYARRAYNNHFTLVGIDPVSPEEAAEVARAVERDARRALELDPTLGFAHAALAVPLFVNQRGEDAEQAFRRAVELSPNDANVLVLYARFKRFRGEHDESVSLLRRAIELDPRLFTENQLAQSYRAAGNWEAAASIYSDLVNREAAQRGGTAMSVYAGAADIQALLRNRSEAIALLEVAEQLDGYLNAFRLAQIAHAYALVGQVSDARRVFALFEREASENPVRDAFWVRAYIAVGDYEQALQRLESATRNRAPGDLAPLAALAANPWKDPELDRPAFRELLDGLWID